VCVLGKVDAYASSIASNPRLPNRLLVTATTRDSFLENLRELVLNHKRILSVGATANSLEEGVISARKSWFPELSVTTFAGYENRNNTEGTANTSLPPRELDLTLTQPIFDFGAKSSTIKLAELQLQKANYSAHRTKQGLILEAISAQVALISASRIKRYAVRSVVNIKRQAQLEDARVSKGSGFSTDVLQAKVQLAGAEARLVQAKGTYKAALNRYRNIFGSLPSENTGLDELLVPVSSLPKHIDDALLRALTKNPQIQSLRIDVDIARTTVQQTRSRLLYPSLNLVLDGKLKRNVSGTRGATTEALVKVEMKHVFNLGGSGLNDISATRSNYTASLNQLSDATNIVEEQARNAYEQLRITQETSTLLRNQANISSEFLELARKERRLGRRSLIDVLAGETAEINALSDAEAVKSQVIIAAYNMLFIMGELEIINIETK
jgi:adhesin transport system outer membrane protein